MKLVALKNNLGGQIWYRIVYPVKNQLKKLQSKNGVLDKKKSKKKLKLLITKKKL